MSRTQRLCGYKRGKPVYSKNENKEAFYRWANHEHVLTRRILHKRYRRKCKIAIARGDEVPRWTNTCGWVTW